MEKKKLTGDELERFLFGLSFGFTGGGLAANCVEVFFIGGFFVLAGLGWLMFKEAPQTKRNPPNRPHQ